MKSSKPPTRDAPGAAMETATGFALTVRRSISLPKAEEGAHEYACPRQNAQKALSALDAQRQPYEAREAARREQVRVLRCCRSHADYRRARQPAVHPLPPRRPP